MGLFGALLLSSIIDPMGDLRKEVPHFKGFNYAIGGYNPEFHPRRGKFKGYMRENKRCTFNKNR